MQYENGRELNTRHCEKVMLFDHLGLNIRTILSAKPSVPDAGIAYLHQPLPVNIIITAQ